MTLHIKFTHSAGGGVIRLYNVKDILTVVTSDGAMSLSVTYKDGSTKAYSGVDNFRVHE